MGLAFQLTDDLLGIWGNPARTGKPVLADLRTRKTSIPVAVALDASTDSARRLADLYTRHDDLTDDEAALAATLVEDAGGRAWAEAEIVRHIDAAARCLDPFGPGSPQRAAFMAVADFVTSRDR
jgi:geranylgeranyl diphosphate synthase type I